MNAIPRLLLLLLLVALAAMTPPARSQTFFFDGTDYAHHAPLTLGRPNGTIYVGEYTGDAPCHYRFFPPAASGTVSQVKLAQRDIQDGGLKFTEYGVSFVNGQGRFQFANRDVDFKKVCPPGSRAERSAAASGDGPLSIPVSNDADSFDLTCDGRYAVVVGANSPTPVSLVDLQTGAEVDKFAAESNATYATTFDDGESVVVVLNIPPANASNRLRRLKIVNGKLVDTGESLAPAGTGPDRRFVKVFAVPGSKVGVALGQFGAPGVTTFSIPGLQVLDSLSSSGGDSAAVSCAGDKVYLRGGSQIVGFTLDPVTGALGDTPFLRINGVGQTDFFVSNFGNALEVSRDGTRLIVPEGTAFPNSPATPRVTYFDTTTGARLGFFDAFDGGSPTLVSTIPCCAGTGLRLGIQRLASGLIQITATGETGQKYELQKSQNLIAWDKLLEFQMTASPAPYTDPDSQTNSTRFYRLKLIP